LLDRSKEEQLTSNRFDREFVLPSYDDYCVSNVPGVASSIFGIPTGKALPLLQHISHKVNIDNVQNVVMLVLDGFGFEAWTKQTADGGFFQSVTDGGLVLPITTVFPSTTAAALTSINTGLTPQEHGLPEWFVYMKELDEIIETLPFTPMGSNQGDSLIGRVSPRILFSAESLHSRMQRSGVDSVALLPGGIARRAFTKLIFGRGSRIVPYGSLAGFAVSLRKRLTELRNKTLVYAYWDLIDISGHDYGPDSVETNAEISSLSLALKREFVDKLDRETAKRTLLLVTADHGQIKVNPEDTVYLNRFRRVVSAFARSKAGKVILPSWSPRDVALYMHQGELDRVQSRLIEVLGDRALVLKTSEAIQAGLFGIGRPTRRFVERAGNLLILPRSNHMVWYRHSTGEEFDLLGMHGGLTRGEMLVPLAAARLD
jgi:predicted AlkP superfamily pyrophosphatase or phosphodiesterase